MIPRLRSILDWLLNPSSHITEPEKIQRSRLLSTILLALMLLGMTILGIVAKNDPSDIQEPESQSAILMLCVIAVMYLTNRMGHNHYAAIGVIFPFVIIFTTLAFSSSGKSVFLAFLLIPILLTAIFFSLKWTSIINGSILLLILILLASEDQASPASPFWVLRSMWFFLLLATGLIIVFMWHLGNLEKIRQSELLRVNKELQQKIAELERFTYTVSHELKAPIVTIKGFLGSVEKDLKVGRTERALNDLARISRAADNMHTTLSDLLALSRVGHLVNPFSEFPLSELVQEAIESTRGTIQSHEIRLTVEPALPKVYGDRQRLREVFENLIDNATKYMGNQPNPVIVIGVREDKETVFFVRDNGIGIEPQFHKKIFGLFDKLDTTTEGMGIGLALIKRIVEVHDGKIWVESEGLRKGSTFCFTIPDVRQNKSGGS